MSTLFRNTTIDGTSTWRASSTCSRGLRHRSIRRCHHQDRAVHLRRTRDHVLDVVTVSGHVHVRIVPLVRLVFHVRNVDRDAARFLFRRIVDLVVGLEIRLAQHLRHLRDRRRQRRLAMVDVSHRPHIQMRLAPVKFLPSPCLILLLYVDIECFSATEPSMGFEPVTSPLPRVCSTD